MNVNVNARKEFANYVTLWGKVSILDLVKNNFREKYTIETIECKRSINSKNPGEKVNEVIITRQKI